MTYTIPGASLPATGVYLAEDPRDRHGHRQPHHRSSSATTTASARREDAVRPPDGDLPGLQQLGRQVALLGQERQRRHGGRHAARGQGVLQPADRQRRPPTTTASAGRTATCRLARAAGLRRLLHRRASPCTRTPPSCAQHDDRHARRARRVHVRRGDGGPQGRARRGHQHRSTSAPTPATGRSATRTAGGRSSVTRRSRAPARSGSGTVDAERPWPRRRHGDRGRRARGGRHRGHGGRPARRTPPRRSATTARRPGTRTRPRAAASGPTAGELALRGHVHRRQPQTDVGGARAPPRTRTASSRATAHGATRGSRPRQAAPRAHRHDRLGVGRRSRARRSTSSKQPAGVKRLSDTDTRLSSSNFIQDEGRVYTHTPPPGRASSTRSATAPPAAPGSSPPPRTSGATGSTRPSSARLTYNVISDMGVQPGTPDGIVTDAGNQAPRAVATASPTSGPLPLAVSFNGAGSSDPDGTDHQVRVGPRRQRGVRRLDRGLAVVHLHAVGDATPCGCG